MENLSRKGKTEEIVPKDTTTARSHEGQMRLVKWRADGAAGEDGKHCRTKEPTDEDRKTRFLKKYYYFVIWEGTSCARVW